jgi:hypothetical protein
MVWGRGAADACIAVFSLVAPFKARDANARRVCVRSRCARVTRSAAITTTQREGNVTAPDGITRRSDMSERTIPPFKRTTPLRRDVVAKLTLYQGREHSVNHDG